MARNQALARMNADRALARRQAKQRAEEKRVRRCCACGGVIAEGAAYAVIANGRTQARSYHQQCEGEVVQ